MSPCIRRVQISDCVWMPVVGYGTGTALYHKDAKDSVIMAFSKGGLRRFDCAEMYANERTVRCALEEMKVSPQEVFLTTKCGLQEGSKTDPRESLVKSLDMLGVAEVDLFLIHAPSVVKDMGLYKAWEVMEQLLFEGKTRSIGVSNHRLECLEEILKHAKVAPSINQIEVHPYVYDKAQPIIEFCKARGITIETYGALAPLTRYPGGPVDPVVQVIAQERDATESQILLKWATQISHGGPVVTTSNKEERLLAHAKALTEIDNLTDAQMQAIAEAGKQKPQRFRMQDMNED